MRSAARGRLPTPRRVRVSSLGLLLAVGARRLTALGPIPPRALACQSKRCQALTPASPARIPSGPAGAHRMRAAEAAAKTNPLLGWAGDPCAALRAAVLAPRPGARWHGASSLARYPRKPKRASRRVAILGRRMRPRVA